MGQARNLGHAGYLVEAGPEQKVDCRLCSKNEIQIRIIKMMPMYSGNTSVQHLREFSGCFDSF